MVSGGPCGLLIPPVVRGSIPGVRPTGRLGRPVLLLEAGPGNVADPCVADRVSSPCRGHADAMWPQVNKDPHRAGHSKGEKLTPRG